MHESHDSKKLLKHQQKKKHDLNEQTSLKRVILGRTSSRVPLREKRKVERAVANTRRMLIGYVFIDLQQEPSPSALGRAAGELQVKPQINRPAAERRRVLETVMKSSVPFRNRK
ncbi:hypothetical protein EVAR_37343_1 [Eumeta japonica]|uniref:Uncharacterized protein n=1 Tax=Eumeta variegata TaxID=151549 RepID=A0A4C1WXS7_EUMVA|nr:hypothetical protein EVAR_37343_1 [Eumeta japonica]